MIKVLPLHRGTTGAALLAAVLATGACDHPFRVAPASAPPQDLTASTERALAHLEAATQVLFACGAAPQASASATQPIKPEELQALLQQAKALQQRALPVGPAGAPVLSIAERERLMRQLQATAVRISAQLDSTTKACQEVAGDGA